MNEIIILVRKSEIELFTQLCLILNCFISSTVEAKENNYFVTVGSQHLINLYQLGFEFGAYVPTFQKN